MGQKAQTNVRTTKDKKEQWREIAEKHGHGNVPQLIRIAMQQYINGNGNSGDGGGVPGEGIAEVKEEIRQLRSTVESMDESVETLETDTFRPVSNYDTESLYEVLPTDRGDAMTEAEVADELEIEEQEAASHLAKLRHELTAVQIGVIDGEPVYWRRQ